ncbi:MAG: hypothetical protein CMM77_00340 [Rhodospirillaceae bacterium]|jgi:hypothetical protein|nr:hypothetical protein [Magnetovibrio sp.]MAY65555.1 hypothetical protein [Rhodospirillaceae bacterium]
MTNRNRTPVLTAGLILAAAMMGAVDAAAATRTEVKRMIIEEAMNSRVPPALALAVAKVESDFQDRALSTAGARGVMQIMPKTARDEFGVGQDELWNARLNIQLGIDYLERLYDQYGGRWDLALSHYNGGTLKGGRGVFAEPHSYTRKYVANVLTWQARYGDQARVWQVADAGEPADGWRAARTKPARDPESDVAVPWRITVTEIPDHEQKSEGLSVADGIQDRIRRARRGLDDFAERAKIRWYEG